MFCSWTSLRNIVVTFDVFCFQMMHEDTKNSMFWIRFNASYFHCYDAEERKSLEGLTRSSSATDCRKYVEGLLGPHFNTAAVALYLGCCWFETSHSSKRNGWSSRVIVEKWYTSILVKSYAIHSQKDWLSVLGGTLKKNINIEKILNQNDMKKETAHWTISNRRKPPLW